MRLVLKPTIDVKQYNLKIINYQLKLNDNILNIVV